MTPDPIGVASARERDTSGAEVISAVEQIGTDIQITVGHVSVRHDGTLGRTFERAPVRLPAADLDRLIDTLTSARITL